MGTKAQIERAQMWLDSRPQKGERRTVVDVRFTQPLQVEMILDDGSVIGGTGLIAVDVERCKDNTHV